MCHGASALAILQRPTHGHHTKRSRGSLPTQKKPGRYWDDGIMFVQASDETMHQFFEQANARTEGIKFTYEICRDQATFLDLAIFKGNRFQATGHLDVKMYRQPTETFQYLYRNSCHPQTAFGGLVKGEMRSICRNCSNPKDRDQQIQLFHEKLRARGYTQKELTTARRPIVTQPRPLLLEEKNREKKKTSPPPLVMTTTFNPRIKGLTKALRKHWKTIMNDPECKEIFTTNGPMVAYKRPKNLGDTLISSKLRPK
ncbi:hypothetical protein BaRGS_00026377 [Batillaria attramentaria]|uniref:Helix-turn-helix domain-containing protein n=1 Tax=Batillaria attramentaria TaxID=370345 RepID=A0ABD0K5J1_9CAEN